MRGRTLVALLTIAILAVTTLGYAQRFGGGGRRGFDRDYFRIRRPDATSFTGDFTFCRLAHRRAYDGDGGGWGVDYPRADQNLSIRLFELTKTRVNVDRRGNPNFYVIQAIEPELYQCPFVMMSEPGGAFLDENEAKALREYLLKGGFIWADDFWGEYAWLHWVEEVRKIFPDRARYPIVDVPIEHSIFHTLFDSKKLPQIPSIGYWGGPGSTTSERGRDSAVPHARAILDDKGRVMFFMTHNTDFGDAYEREGDDPQYFYTFSVDGYAIGIDVVLYAMTH